MTKEKAIKNIKEHCYFANLIPQAKEALDMAIKSLEEEPCDDAISRQTVKEKMIKYGFHAPDMTVTEFVEDELTPVTSQPKTGRWIENHTKDGCGELYSHWICSECGRSVGFNYADIEDVLSEYPFCHCGAKMEEVEE